MPTLEKNGHLGCLCGVAAEVVAAVAVVAVVVAVVVGGPVVAASQIWTRDVFFFSTGEMKKFALGSLTSLGFH